MNTTIPDDTSENLLKLAHLSIQSGNTDEGVDFVNEYLKHNQNNAEAWNIKALLIATNPKTDILLAYQEVLAIMNKAISLDEKYIQELRNHRRIISSHIQNDISTIIRSHDEQVLAIARGYGGIYDFIGWQQKIVNSLLVKVDSYMLVYPNPGDATFISLLKAVDGFISRTSFRSPKLKELIKTYSHQVNNTSERANPQVKADPVSPRRCANCSKELIAGEISCSHCGSVDWANVLSTITALLIVSLPFILIGVIFCDSNFWRFLWISPGVLLLFIAAVFTAVGLIKSSKRKRGRMR